MASPLRFRLPVQGQGIGGGVGQESGVEWHHVYALGGAANGLPNWSRQLNYTGFTHDTEYLMRLRNRGSGGRHLSVLKSTDASTVLQILDTGLTTPLAITSTLATGTAPFTVASTTVVTNLNADLLDGNHAAAFLTQASADLRYLQLTGGTLTGDLDITGELSVTGNVALGNQASDVVTVAGDMTVGDGLDVDGSLDVTGESTLRKTTVTGAGAGNDQALYLQHGAGDGTFTLGASNAADPVLVFKDNSGDQVFEVGNSASTYAARVLGSLRVTNDVLIDSKIEVTADSSVFSGTVTFADQVAFNDPVTFTDNPTVTGTDLNLSTAYIDFDLGSGAGFTEDTWGGYIEAKHDGSVIYIPYLSSPP